MDHYFSENPDSELIKSKISINLKEDHFFLWSASGLFSKDKLDFATKLLIENCELPSSGRILDLGCGYGVVGISILRNNKDLDVVFSDVNRRAIDLTKENLAFLNLHAKVFHSDLFEKIKGSFDVILSNPPMATGRKNCFLLINESFMHLNVGGSLQIVGRHNKGGSALESEMAQVFGNVKTIIKRGGFRVYVSIKN
ncbi:methyltransferase [Candidatus Woesearchaeota archaeon]|nr:methyltransferase [Candidatus Woesearchaeota archaeon]MCF7901513.1 methyltransferase [Candidatus Woesearchaeota archaeon]MCF8013936.1 methyltransferase [Candidatus Woesearchaeota archaeon]